MYRAQLLTAGALAIALTAGGALADTSQKKIAFSNNYAGNSAPGDAEELRHRHQESGRR